MENLKFWISTILVFAVLVGIGYWAVTNIQSGSEHVSTTRLKDLEKENEDLKEEIEKLTLMVEDLQPVVVEEEQVEESEDEPTEVSTPTSYKYQTLIDKVQKLINDNVSMKLKSRGTRVGVVQEFLNVYNGTNSKIDNDYGNGTKSKVQAFQKDQGLTADGQAGPGTFRKMVEWLKKQG